MCVVAMVLASKHQKTALAVVFAFLAVAVAVVAVVVAFLAVALVIVAVVVVVVAEKHHPFRPWQSNVARKTAPTEQTT